MGHFELTVPENGTPLLVEIPHAGLTIPPEVQPQLDVPPDAILRDADIYVDRLYERCAERGATRLAAKLSRYVVDLNRSADDVDAETVPEHPKPRALQPRGVVWRMTTDGRSVLRKPLSYSGLQKRIEQYHRPYHDTLRRELERLRATHGFAVLLAAHSMPSVGRWGHTDTGTRRADIVPGTQGRSTAHPEVVDLVDSHFRAAGLSVRHDDPYRGGYTTAHYGRPSEHWHAIQIELNRALYVDESTAQPKQGDFEALQKVLLELVACLGALTLG
ncbi:MAG: N-formylglutamate amidohydrolase [Myxococcota bacterium]